MKARQLARTAAIAMRNLFVGGNVRLLTRLNRPQRIAELATQNLFLYDSAFNIGLEKKNVKDVLHHCSSAEVALFLDSEEFWINEMSSSAADIISLCLIARLTDAKRIFEIGTLNGYTALHFAMNAPQAEVYTLDLPPNSGVALDTTLGDDRFVGDSLKHARLFEGREEAKRIHSLYGDSATFDFSSFHGNIDFFFIDGSHSYEYVRNDTFKALSCCHPGSVIAWHDYGRRGVNGVSRWLHEFAKSNFEIYRVPNGSLAFGVVPVTGTGSRPED
jgi:predicted O-methyltransferase YrrM